MTYHNSVIREYEQSSGIRRTELHYIGDIDASGRLKLKRCVGKSFLDKSSSTGDCLSTGMNNEQAADTTVCPLVTSRSDRSA